MDAVVAVEEEVEGGHTPDRAGRPGLTGTPPGLVSPPLDLSKGQGRAGGEERRESRAVERLSHTTRQGSGSAVRAV